MSKRVKLSDQKKEWYQRSKPLKRNYRTRPQRQRFLIVCEGEKTEPNYLQGLKAKLPPNLVDIKIEGVGANTMSLINFAIRKQEIAESQGQPYHNVWVVFDRDSFPNDNFDNAISMAESRGMKVAWSNEAFELWYLLHFEDRTTAMLRAEFSSKLTEKLGSKYVKNSKDMYRRLEDVGDEEAAMRRASQLQEMHSGVTPANSNPCTHVNKLVEELNAYKLGEITR